MTKEPEGAKGGGVVRRTVGRRFHWRDEDLALMGKIPDRELAERTGLHFWTVRKERIRRNIPPFRYKRPNVEWTPEMVAELGTDSDRAVADRLGISSQSVTRKRKILGIPAFYPRPHDTPLGYDWRPEDLARLGQVSDHELAEELGLSSTTVVTKRQTLGIPPCHERVPRIEWTAERLRRLGTVPDRQLAEELGVCTASIFLKRKELGIPASVRPIVCTPELLELLELPTAEVRRRTGLSATAINRWRRKTGRQVRRKAPRAARKKPAPPRWTPEEIELLGTASDAEIGRRIGRTKAAVRNKRSHLGIPSWRSRPLEVELLGKIPDVELAARCHKSTQTVREAREARGIPAWRPVKRWRPEEVELLGSAPDSELARRLGRNEGGVRAKRDRLGIPSARPYKRWSRDEIELLGTRPDRELARRLDRSVQSVSKKRQVLGIPASPKQGLALRRDD